MNAFDLIRRKYRRQFSDLQLMILLYLGRNGRVQFMELVDAAGVSASGIGNALANPMLEGLVEKERRENHAYYFLTVAGQREVAALFRDQERPPKKP
jgi:DNA-binding MarR family transcriptional regulator